MAEAWLPGAERLDTKTGGAYNGDPWCFVIHTTEGDPGTVNGCRDMAVRSPYPPHLWYHPTLRWLGQTVALDRSAYALEHPSNTYETNKSGALQVEIYGYAATTPDWGVELDNIGVDVLRPILDAGYPIDLDRLARSAGDDGYGTSGAVRMSTDEWSTWNGVCGHANVPANQHWDPGAIDYARIVAAARGGVPPEPEPEVDDMPLHIVVGTQDGRWWLTDWITKRYIGSPDQAAQIIVSTVATGGRIETDGNNGPVVYDQNTVDSVPTVE